MLAHKIQYILLRLFWSIFGLIPAKSVYGLGHWFGCFFFRLSGSRAKVAMQNVLISGITQDHKEAYRIAMMSTGHFIGHILESFRLSDGVKDVADWRSYVEVSGSQEALALLQDKTQPIMVATAHLGSWEVAVPIVSSFRRMLAVARLMDNPYVRDFLTKTHFRGDIEVIAKKRGFSGSVIKQWIAENAALAIVMDQYASKGITVDFFGHPSKVFTSPARIHLKTGIPVVVGSFIRTGCFTYRICLADPVRYTPTGDREADIRICTQQMIASLETLIKEAPEQYLWLHRRWRELTGKRGEKFDQSCLRHPRAKDAPAAQDGE